MKHEIQHVKIAAGAPRANGQVEKLNSVILSCLATTSQKLNSEDWDDNLYEVQWAINSSVHKVTKRTPNELVFNYKVISCDDSPLIREIEEVNREFGTEEEGDDVAQLLEKNRDVLKKQFDKKRKVAIEYKAGDLVMVRSELPATGESRKLGPKYRGPYEVVKGLGNDRYLIQDIEGEQQSNRIYKGIIAVDRLKKIVTDMKKMDKK